MRTLIIVVVVLLVLVGIGALAYQPAVSQWQKLNTPNWRTEEVVVGNIVSTVNTTGTIKPVRSVAVGAFVSGPMIDQKDDKGIPIPIADFNQVVKKDDPLTAIDPIIYQSNVARDRATLEARKADVNRAIALLNLAIRDENRSLLLQQADESFISQAEMDKYYYNRVSLEAQLDVARKAVPQAKAALEFSEANLKYTEIKSPCNGIIISRKIDPGQTVAAQFQTPELFVIGEDMKKRMHVYASVDEADIGLVEEAKKDKHPVWFSVDAYPDELFEGAIDEIRLSSTTTQNVVTYPVIVIWPRPESESESIHDPDAESESKPKPRRKPEPNSLDPVAESKSNVDTDPESNSNATPVKANLKLKPGMTASLSFQVAERKNIIKIPNSALRFYPLLKHVRKEDRRLLEGQEMTAEEKQNEQSGRSLSELERVELRRKRNRRHVWIAEGHLLRAVEVVTGLADSHYTELESGDLKPGDPLVTGIKPKVYGAQ